MAAFVVIVDETYGLYLDATTGFHHNREMMLRGQVETRRLMVPGTDADALPFTYGRGAPTDPTNVIQHTTNQGDYKRRNEKGGSNAVRLAHALIVFLFEAWESEHRKRVAEAVQLDLSAIRVPVMGDLRRLRNDVLHHRGILTDETSERLTTLHVGPVGSSIGMQADEVESLVFQIKAGLDDLVRSLGGTDPAHRTIWHIS